MFYEVQATTYIHVHPKDFGDNLSQEIMDILSKRYINKIIPPKYGLCVTISKIVAIGDKQIYPDDGGTYTKVEFCLILFQPYKSEVIKGRVLGCDATGMTISLEFFDTIFVSIDEMPKPIKYDSSDKCYIYCPKSSDEELQIEINDNVYFRVIDIKFLPIINKSREKINEKELKKKESLFSRLNLLNDKNNDDHDRISDNDNDNDVNHQSQMSSKQHRNGNNGNGQLFRDVVKRESMTVYASMKGPGLGCCEWWD